MYVSYSMYEMYIHFFNIFFSINKNLTVLFLYSLDHANFKDMPCPYTQQASRCLHV